MLFEYQPTAIRRKRIMTFSAVSLLGISLFAYTNAEAASSERGRHIYYQGMKSSGEPITANVGVASIPVPASTLPCVGCHGRDGKGRAEGGVIPSNISWLNLSKKYGGITEVGRRYKAYDESSFLRAVTEGIDSAGNKLDPNMPRFNISRQDARDLVAYLKVIMDDYDPGVSKEQIVLGTLQPIKQAQSEAADAMVSVMQAYLNEINQQGGIYGRSLKLEVAHYDDRQSFISQANKLIREEKIFALVSSFSANADQNLTDMVEDEGMPSIAPYTQFPTAQGGRHRYTFYLHGGLDAEIAALAKRAGTNKGNADKVLVVYKQNSDFESSAQKAITYLKENGIENPQLLAYSTDSTQELSQLVDLKDNPKLLLLFLGASRDLVDLLENETDRQSVPQVLLPGFFVGSDILNLPSGYAEQLEMAYITVPGTNDGRALSEFRQFMHRNKLEYNYLPMRLFAYSAVRTLVEGIKRSGKRITRDKVVKSIEDLYAYDVGLNRPISYGSQRRIGLLGAHIVKLDKAQNRLSPTGVWVKLD